ncbi:MAG: AMP-binding protein [Acidimicrobiia bacterium]|nr:AMP-binding protein [Acidimicrobiia bacterium]
MGGTHAGGGLTVVAPVWLPDEEVRQRSVTARFMDEHQVASYDELVERSVAEPEWFWAAVVDFLGIPFARPFTRVREQGAGVPWTTWFDDGALNLSAACVDRWADDPDHAGREALVCEREDGSVTASTFAELRDLVGVRAAGLAAQGVGRGDRVAVMAGLGDAVTVLLAVARLGAVAVPIFSGFGAGAAAARLVDAECRLLVISTDLGRRGRPVPLAAVADDAVREAARRGVAVAVVGVGALDVDAPPLDPVVTAAEDPVLVAYTSGTTGEPKGAVHVHGGLTVKLAQEGAFSADLRPGDRASWLTDMGWIMGPWITVAALANGATLVTYDGAPDWPDPDRLWSIVERHRLSFLGVSPTLVRSLAGSPDADERVARADLSSLRAFGSTGEPWNDAAWWGLFDGVGGARRPIVNLSGGTEVGACLLSVNLLEGCVPCSVGGPSLGVAVDVVGSDGRPVRGSGQVGELVVRDAWPAMTRGIWGDPDRYLATYWSRYPGMWHHGDWAEVDDDGFWFLHGRSDDTLSIAGKRIGPAEIESAAVAVDGVTAAAAVGLPHAVKGESVGLWCVPTAGATPGGALAQDDLAASVADAVVASFGKAFRPARVVFVDALPQTHSGKVLRRAIRARALGHDVGDLPTIEDAAVLEHIRPLHGGLSEDR